ncbi:MAG: hypothetical protein ACRD3O_21960 [Terriglobia bacterium]
MTSKNRSVPVDTVLPHVQYQKLGDAGEVLRETMERECFRHRLEGIRNSSRRGLFLPQRAWDAGQVSGDKAISH